MVESQTSSGQQKEIDEKIKKLEEEIQSTESLISLAELRPDVDAKILESLEKQKSMQAERRKELESLQQRKQMGWEIQKDIANPDWFKSIWEGSVAKKERNDIYPLLEDDILRKLFPNEITEAWAECGNSNNISDKERLVLPFLCYVLKFHREMGSMRGNYLVGIQRDVEGYFKISRIIATALQNCGCFIEYSEYDDKFFIQDEVTEILHLHRNFELWAAIFEEEEKTFVAENHPNLKESAEVNELGERSESALIYQNQSMMETNLKMMQTIQSLQMQVQFLMMNKNTEQLSPLVPQGEDGQVAPPPSNERPLGGDTENQSHVEKSDIATEVEVTNLGEDVNISKYKKAEALLDISHLDDSPAENKEEDLQDLEKDSVSEEENDE